LERGFNTTGLFAYSRHPNFFAEQTIWFMLYQWACFSTNTLYNWTFAGSAFLILLFQGSTWLTELITSGKYPEYVEYKKQVPMFMPSIRYLGGYTPPGPKVIRTSDLVKRQEGKKQK
jgi:steroid 5-alpha reductase family enzyme